MRVSRREAERLPSTRRALNVWSRNLRWSWNCLLHTCSYYLFQCQETDKTANLQTNRLPHIQELNSPLSTAATSMGSWFHMNLSFDPISSVGKESTCNAGDHFLIPWSGRSAGEGIGYPLQYSWASLVAQLVQKTLIRVKESLASWNTVPYVFLSLPSNPFMIFHDPWGAKGSARAVLSSLKANSIHRGYPLRII